jgi:hypothetical protein
MLWVGMGGYTSCYGWAWVGIGGCQVTLSGDSHLVASVTKTQTMSSTCKLRKNGEIKTDSSKHLTPIIINFGCGNKLHS